MRLHYRRLALIVCGCFFTTIVLLSVIGRDDNADWLIKQARQDKLPRPVPRDIKNYLSNSKIDVSDGVQNYFAPQVDWTLVDNFERYLSELNIQELVSAECQLNETLRQLWKRKKSKTVPEQDSWEKFYADIGSCDLYRDEKILENLLTDLSRMPIKTTTIMEGGTQVKLLFTFQNDQQAVFKPMRFGRDYETDPNHFYFSDFERHHAEIATFHLDKILGFRRAVPTVGRTLNITSELYEKAEKRLKRTFFLSPAKNHCFVSKCDYYCDTTHAICGNPDIKEGSVQVFLPDESNVLRKHNKSPYRRTYSKRNQIAAWQENMNYCTENVKNKKLFAHGRQLLDLIDLHIMDYLIGNQDRHHYESLNVFGQPYSYTIHIDNGRAFGRTDIDDDDILLPLRQCCLIRPSTLLKLLSFYGGPLSLTKSLHESLYGDPVAPVLAMKHYPAIERRLHNVIAYVDECIKQHPDGARAVIAPQFHNNKVAINEVAEEDASEDAAAAAKNGMVENARVAEKEAVNNVADQN